MTVAFSSAPSELLKSAADTPLPTSVSTWSFMSEMSGDTTTARPLSAAAAGAWKQSDLPPPVGSTTIESRPESTASMASCWSGRNDV